MKSRLVWTSDPEAAKRLREEGAVEARVDQEPAKQSIRVVVDRKRRAGKSVTVASGFQMTGASLAELAAALKKRCGAGGRREMARSRSRAITSRSWPRSSSASG